jgi:hypothetical protein
MNSLDSTFGIATGYGLDYRGFSVRVLVGLWGPPNFLFNLYGEWLVSKAGQVAGAGS